MSSTPGSRTPGEQPTTEQTVGEVNVDVGSTGTTDLGGVIADEATAREVRVESSDQDFDFNVEAEGADLFGSEQSPSSAEQSFSPDQNARTAGSYAVQYALDVSSASANGSATATVQVLVEYRHD
jgi:hypothetical protein